MISVFLQNEFSSRSSTSVATTAVSLTAINAVTEAMSGSGRPKNTISPAWLTGEGAADGALSADSGSNGNGVSDSGVAHSSASHAASVKNETVQPKSEPFKPKFAPKVPVKKEPSVASAAASAR